MQKNQGLIKPTLQITFFSIIGIIIGFVSQMIIAYYFGTKFERDAYFVAIIIPTYISSIFIGSFGIIFLPKVIDILSRDDRQSLSEFICSVFFLLIAILLFITIGCILFSNEVTSLFAPGYNADQIAFTSKILIIVIPTIIFSVLSNLLGALYQIEHKFIRPALVPIISSIISVLFVIIFSNKIGIFGLALGFFLGSLISFISLFPIIRTYNLKFKINLRNVDISSFVKTVTPLLLAGVLFRSTGVIERMIASNLPQGSISFLGYSNLILTSLLTLTASGIAITSYPTLSKLWTERKKPKIEIFFEKTIRIILLISIPIIISIIVFGGLFIKIIFERGAFTSSNTIAVGKALSWLMGAFIFQSLGSVVMKVFYLTSKTITLTIIASIELFIYLLLSFLLSKYYSFIGLAIALSFSSFVSVFLALFIINRTLIKIRFLSLFLYTLKIILVSAISILVIYLLYYYIIGIHSILYLIVCYFFGLTTFVFMGIFFRINEILYLKKINLKKMKIFNFNIMSIKSIIKFFIPLKIRTFVWKNINNLNIYCKYINYKYLKKKRNLKFSFNSEEYNYFLAPYNTTFQNERAVEIPIILKFIAKYKKLNILEIGNVISHYKKYKYDIVDKYEKGEGVLNFDIINFIPIKKYDLIVSISTFEHIGFDEVKRYSETKNIEVQEMSLIKAIEKTKTLLKQNGIFIFTVPVGFNSFLDTQIKNNSLNLTDTFFLKRISINNEWVQVQYKEIKDIKYGQPYSCANGLMIGIYKNKL